MDTTDNNNKEALEVSLRDKYFIRFIRLIEFNFDLAVLLIKNWLNKPTEKNAQALQALGQNLTDEEITSFFEKLSITERQKWKEIIKGYLGLSDLKLASKFISEELTREMISNNTNYDLELFDLLSSLGTPELLQFIKTSPETTAALFNTLPASKLASLLSEVPKDEASKYIEASFKATIERDDAAYEALKKTLSKFHAQIENKPFTSKLLEMLPSFNPLRERVIYQSLFKSISKSEIKSVAQKNFPYELFTLLPTNIIKESLKNYPEEDRVQFLVSIEEQEKNFYLEAFAPQGTPMRDMLDLAIEEIESNPARLNQAKRSSTQNIKSFIKFHRNFLLNNPSYAPILNEILETWIGDQLNSASENVLDFKSNR